MEYVWTCLVSGIFCAAVGGLECGVAAVIVGAVVVKVAKSIIKVRPLL